jgi:hypothetical protein
MFNLMHAITSFEAIPSVHIYFLLCIFLDPVNPLYSQHSYRAHFCISVPFTVYPFNLLYKQFKSAFKSISNLAVFTRSLFLHSFVLPHLVFPVTLRNQSVHEYICGNISILWNKCSVLNLLETKRFLNTI